MLISTYTKLFVQTKYYNLLSTIGRLGLIATFIFLILLKIWKYNQISKLEPKEKDKDSVETKENLNEKELYNDESFPDGKEYKNSFMDSEERWKKLYKK